LFIFASALPSTLYAQDRSEDTDIPIFIDDKEVTEGVLPRLRDGRIFGPIRNVSETLGAQVTYFEDTREILIQRDDLEVQLTVDSTRALVTRGSEEPVEKTFDVPVFVHNGRSFIPLRFLAEQFQYDVKWDGETRTVSLTSKEDKVEDPDKDPEDAEEEVPEEPDEKKEEDEEKDKEEKEKPDPTVTLNVDKQDEKIKLILEFKEGLDSDFSYEVDFSKDDEVFHIVFDEHYIQEERLSFEDPLLEEIMTHYMKKDPPPNDGEETYEDPLQKYSADITVLMKYTVPEIEIDKDNDQFKVVIPRLFKTIEEEKELASGLNYTAIRKGKRAGPVNISELRLDANSDLRIDLALANDQISGLESLDSMAKRYDAVAGINGGYFHYQGNPLGLFMKDQMLITMPTANRSAFIKTPNNLYSINTLNYQGAEVTLGSLGESIPIDRMNRSRGTGEVVVYTREYGDRTGTRETAPDFLKHTEVTVENGRVTNIQTGNSRIPRDGYVVSIHGDFVYEAGIDVDQLRVGDQANLVWNFFNWNSNNIELALGAGPRIASRGNVDIRSVEEQIAGNISWGRAPRTAVGITSGGDLLLTTVDGRQPSVSIGMTLEELAKFKISRGARDALNLDGGGSTMMWFDGDYQNVPSGGPRSIGNAILIVE